MPSDLSFYEFIEAIPDEQTAVAYFESIRMVLLGITTRVLVGVPLC